MAWIFSKMGFYSIVLGDHDEWQVRSRSRQHLVNLIKEADLRAQKVVSTPGRDYRYRLYVKAEELSRIFECFSKIDYRNYKQKLGSTPGMEKFCDAAHKVWAVMATLQDAPPWSNRQLPLSDDPKPTPNALDDVEPPAPDVIHAKRGNGRKHS